MLSLHRPLWDVVTHLMLAFNAIIETMRRFNCVARLRRALALRRSVGGQTAVPNWDKTL